VGDLKEGRKEGECEIDWVFEGDEFGGIRKVFFFFFFFFFFF
jgi:hypothetical protein